MTTLTRSALRWMEARRRRAALRRLLDHDDAMLADMGLVRAEVVEALRLPVGEDAGAAARRASRAALGLDRWRGRGAPSSCAAE